MIRSVPARCEIVFALSLIPVALIIGCGGGGGGGVVPPGNQPPIVTTPNLNPANVDFSGQPTVTITVNVTDEDLNTVTVTATARRQSDGATFAITNFTRNGGTFTGTFTAPPNSGAVEQRYLVTVSVSDGVNPAVNVQAAQNIVVSPPQAPPPPPLP